MKSRSLSPAGKEEETIQISRNCGRGNIGHVNVQLVSPSRPPSPSPSSMEENLRSSSAYKKGMVKYKECLKNHAAAVGGNATDGCGEFMPSGEDGTLEALKCSACNCHRNFHRKEIECDDCPFGYCYHSAALLNNATAAGRKLVVATPHHHNYNIYPAAGTLISSRLEPAQQIIMSYKGGGGTGSIPSETDEKDDGGGGVALAGRPTAGNKVIRKRFRTKFTAEQKEKMLKFAEKAGWRIQKLDESVVQQFCQEVGIKRRVLKVWMHNNKQSLAKKNDDDHYTPNSPACLN